VPVSYASVTELNGMLAQLETTSKSAQADLAKLHIERWKTDNTYKKQSLANVDSIQRNLQNALPEIVAQLRNSPEDLATTFKLYRNLDALYGVLGSVVESAGAFGSRDEFQSLQNDLNSLERARRSFADRMDTLAQSKEGELARLRAQIQTLQAAQTTAPPPPKKTVVDDTEAPKKTVKKKTPKKSTSSSTQQNPTPNNSESKPQTPPQSPQSQPQ